MVKVVPNKINADFYGPIDEIVAFNAYVHLEQLSENRFYLVVEDGESRVHVEIGSVTDRARVATWPIEETTKQRESECQRDES